jgi:hypothetical protein
MSLRQEVRKCGAGITRVLAPSMNRANYVCHALACLRGEGALGALGQGTADELRYRCAFGGRSSPHTLIQLII